VRFAEWNALFYKIIGHIRSRRKVTVNGRAHSLLVHGQGGYHRGQPFYGNLDRVYRIKQAFFIFLKIAVIRHGQSLEYGKKRKQVAVQPSALAAYQFSQIRVSLLRHYRRTGGKIVRKPYVRKF